jgi:hypothetical protein
MTFCQNLFLKCRVFRIETHSKGDIKHGDWIVGKASNYNDGFSSQPCLMIPLRAALFSSAGSLNHPLDRWIVPVVWWLKYHQFWLDLPPDSCSSYSISWKYWVKCIVVDGDHVFCWLYMCHPLSLNLVICWSKEKQLRVNWVLQYLHGKY